MLALLRKRVIVAPLQNRPQCARGPASSSRRPAPRWRSCHRPAGSALESAATRTCRGPAGAWYRGSSCHQERVSISSSVPRDGGCRAAITKVVDASRREGKPSRTASDDRGAENTRHRQQFAPGSAGRRHRPGWPFSPSAQKARYSLQVPRPAGGRAPGVWTATVCGGRAGATCCQGSRQNRRPGYRWAP